MISLAVIMTLYMDEICACNDQECRDERVCSQASIVTISPHKSACANLSPAIEISFGDNRPMRSSKSGITAAVRLSRYRKGLLIHPSSNREAFVVSASMKLLRPIPTNRKRKESLASIRKHSESAMRANSSLL